ncbi:MAG: 16S rRNA (cytidine(1402)-2'-O)-methyltransferase [Clostridia bacterium]|nr:16S rRNA (cytidine(1402)-2'-O)-methyltransferase [Clostridia bacterium]
MAKLFVVATPIGNLADFSARAIDTLKAVDVIACEDTRHSKILLDKYNITTKVIAYHKFNEKNSTEGIIKLIKGGKNVALISDAGMPLVCDPGQILIARMIEEGLEYTVIPGANAMLCALVMSGFDTSSFAFFGFLSEKNKECNRQLNEISTFKGVSVIYSSKHNINADLNKLANALGKRRVCVVSEISKVYEKVEFLSLGEIVLDNNEPIVEQLDNGKSKETYAITYIANPTGEYVIVIDKGEVAEVEASDDDCVNMIASLVSTGTNLTDACKQIAKETKRSKRDLYNMYLKSQNK